MLTSATPLRRIYVGQPGRATDLYFGSSEIVLTAKTAGVSSMVLWDDAGGRRLYTVSADIDPEALRDSFNAAFPGSSIHVETGEGKIFLTGTVASDAAIRSRIQDGFAVRKEVVNALHVVPVHARQVELKLRIVEVDRTRLDQLGINLFAGGRTALANSTRQFGAQLPAAVPPDRQRST